MVVLVLLPVKVFLPVPAVASLAELVPAASEISTYAGAQSVPRRSVDA